jgi:hypothetical protein
MNALASPAITELSAAQAAHTLLAEWLRGWFNGSLHQIGQNPPVQFPAVNIAFGQGAPVQPLYTGPGTLDGEIRVITFPRTETQESLDTSLFAGKLATDYVLFNFWVSAKHPGPGQSEYKAQVIADLLRAILANPDARYPLVAGGIVTLRPQLPQPIPGADYHKRLVACSGQLQYPIRFDPQPPDASNDIPELPIAAWGQSLEFFNEAPLIVGNYLLGAYTAPCAMILQTVNVNCWPPQGSAVGLQLELDGALVNGATITINPGTPNVDVQVSASLGNLVLNAGSKIRWRVVSAPPVANSAWHLSLETVAVVKTA